MTLTLPLQTLASLPGKYSMGDYVTFNHRAGVARYKKIHPELEEVGWKITQGCLAGEKDLIWHPTVDIPIESGHKRYMFADWPQSTMCYKSKINKTVMVWPESGVGWIIGYIRKGIGRSESGFTSGYEYPEYEPGYFTVDMYVDLYVVKTEFYGTEYILCPIWGVEII